ncbi:TSUP family transporter [Rhizobium puerariae]|uniref:Probable membrane transporter protein n=1 Tax=Rhizobium puerariae TaxID=1585791 RepID=A0ABV6AFW2_9HYPH
MIDAFVPPDISWQFAAILVFASFFTSALTASLGLGGGVAMLAVMGAGMPVANLLPVHGIVQLGSNFGRTVVQHRHVIWPLVMWFLIGSVIGIAFGGPVVVFIPDAFAKIMLRLFILWSVLGRTLKPDTERVNRGFFIAGDVVTSFGMMIVGATEPLVAALLSTRGITKQPLIATHATCMVVQHGLKILAFGLLGFAYAAWLPMLGAMIASGFAGTLAGTLALDNMPERQALASRGHRLIVGSHRDIADDFEEWFTSGTADGFNVIPPVAPESLEDFVTLVVPELQKRGLFRIEYTGMTLRDHLGLPRPVRR